MSKINHYVSLIIGLLLAAISFNLFLAPNNLVAGGVSGFSLILGKIFSINESLFIMLSNIVLLFFSLTFLGKKKTKNTILGSILFPIFINITNYIIPLININEIELIVKSFLGGILSGIGYGLIFKSGYTSGGTDIINQIIEKYFHIPISTSIIIIDGLITLIGGLTFGIETMAYSLISLILLSVFSNKTIIGEGKSKTLYIISSKYNEIKYYLHEELRVDSTDFEISGGYSEKNKKMIMTIINTKDYYKIKEALKIIDNNAFIATTNAYQLVNENLTIRNNY